MEENSKDVIIIARFYIDGKDYFLLEDEKIYTLNEENQYEEFIEYTNNNLENHVVKKIKNMLFPESRDIIFGKTII